MFHVALPWNSGETRMHRLLNVPSHDNPTVSALSPQASNMLQRGPLIAVGTLDAAGNPWTTVWGGEPGLSQPVGASIIGIKTPVERTHDPVVQALFGNVEDGEIVREQGQGRMVSALTLDLETRKRVKLYGRMVAGALGRVGGEEGQEEGSLAQLVVRIDQSLGTHANPLSVSALILTSSFQEIVQNISTRSVSGPSRLQRRSPPILLCCPPLLSPSSLVRICSSCLRQTQPTTWTPTIAAARQASFVHVWRNAPRTQAKK